MRQKFQNLSRLSFHNAKKSGTKPIRLFCFRIFFVVHTPSIQIAAKSLFKSPEIMRSVVVSRTVRSDKAVISPFCYQDRSGHMFSVFFEIQFLNFQCRHLAFPPLTGSPDIAPVGSLFSPLRSDSVPHSIHNFFMILFSLFLFGKTVPHTDLVVRIHILRLQRRIRSQIDHRSEISSCVPSEKNCTAQ